MKKLVRLSHGSLLPAALLLLAGCGLNPEAPSTGSSQGAAGLTSVEGRIDDASNSHQRAPAICGASDEEEVIDLLYAGGTLQIRATTDPVSPVREGTFNLPLPPAGSIGQVGMIHSFAVVAPADAPAIATGSITLHWEIGDRTRGHFDLVFEDGSEAAGTFDLRVGDDEDSVSTACHE
jgi:hypothetical protein